MGIERGRFGFDGEITFECDECGEELHTDTPDFTVALQVLRDNGWKSCKLGGDWMHYCGCDKPDEQEELDDDFKEFNGH